MDKLLREHGRLFETGLANKSSIDSFNLWLDAMRQLLSKQDQSEVDSALVSSIEKLAKEACDEATGDFGAANIKIKNVLWWGTLSNEPDLYHWDKSRGLGESTTLGEG